MSYIFKNHLSKPPLQLFFAVILTVALNACGGGSDFGDLSDFYYPVEKLDAGLVYEYRHPEHDSIAPFYTHFKKEKRGDSLFLVGMQYNYRFEPQQRTVEEKISNGMLLTESTLFQNDSAGQQVSMPMQIEVGSAFPFEVKDSSSVFVYNVKWFEPGDTSKFTRLIRNRSLGGDTTFVFENVEYPSVKMNVREKVESFDQGFVEHEFNSLEIYAKGIGLVYYRKNVTADLIIEYRLSDRYPMRVLEQKFARPAAENN